MKAHPVPLVCAAGRLLFPGWQLPLWERSEVPEGQEPSREKAESPGGTHSPRWTSAGAKSSANPTASGKTTQGPWFKSGGEWVSGGVRGFVITIPNLSHSLKAQLLNLAVTDWLAGFSCIQNCTHHWKTTRRTRDLTVSLRDLSGGPTHSSQCGIHFLCWVCVCLYERLLEWSENVWLHNGVITKVFPKKPEHLHTDY